jgi:hypothetical protein
MRDKLRASFRILGVLFVIICLVERVTGGSTDNWLFAEGFLTLIYGEVFMIKDIIEENS